MGVGGQDHAPAALPQVKTRYPLYRRLVGHQGRSGRVRKISTPTGIRSPDGPGRSESLCRLRYPDRHANHGALTSNVFVASSSPDCVAANTAYLHINLLTNKQTDYIYVACDIEDSQSADNQDGHILRLYIV